MGYTDLRPGIEIVPGYRLIERLGDGGYGVVWRAEGEGGFAVALKLVLLGDAAELVEERSLEVIRDIRHPHLIAIFGAWRVRSYLVIAMELADRTLHARLHEAKEQGLPGIPMRELLEYMDEAAKGLDFLNGSNPAFEGVAPLAVQHRDVKPQNLLLVGGCVKVGDFGLARALEHTLTGHTGSMTPSYAAPEFFRGETTSRSDQYSLAITYCQLRGGRLPFTGGPAAVMAGHLSGRPDLSMIPEAESPAVARALAKEAQDRWPSCREFVRALAQSRTTSGLSPLTRTHAAWPEASPPNRPRSGPVDPLRWGDPRRPEPVAAEKLDRLIEDDGLKSSSRLRRSAAGRVERPDPEPIPAEASLSPASASAPWLRLATAIVATSVLALGWQLNVTPALKESQPVSVEAEQGPIETRKPEPPREEKAPEIITGPKIEGGESKPLAPPALPVEVVETPPLTVQPGRSFPTPPPMAPGTPPFFTVDDPEDRNPDWRGVLLPRTLHGHRSRVTDARFSRSGLRALSGSSDGTVRLWSLKSGRQSTVLDLGVETVAVAFSSDERLAIAALVDGSVATFDLTTGESRVLRVPRVDSGKFPFPGKIRAYLPSRGDRVLFACDDGTARVCDVPSGENLREFRPLGGAGLGRSALSPDGKLALFVSASDPHEVVVWDVDGSRTHRPLTGHRSRIVFVGFSDDGRSALTGGEDGTVMAWNLKKNEPPLEVEFPSGPLDVAASGDDRHLAVVVADGRVQVWDIEFEGPTPNQCPGHATCIRLSPDGLQCLSGHDDGTLRLWRPME